MLCINELYPCYYHYCEDKITKLRPISTFKCAKGLIFDEQTQRCLWAPPWNPCQTNNDNFFFDNLWNETLSDSIKDKKENTTNFKKILEKQTLDYNEFANLNYSFENQNNIERFENDELVDKKKNDINLSQISHIIDQYNHQDEYAYIVIPIKLKYGNISEFEVSNKKKENLKPKTKAKKKQKPKIKKPSQNYDEIFRYKKICYVTNWSQYRPKPAQFLPENVDPFLCTHIVFAFAYIDNTTYTIKTIEENDEDMYRRINDLKYKNPQLKTMLGIGGWNMASKEFSYMVKKKETREIFIVHAIKFLRYHGFDGIDLDWEFPGDRGGSLDDKPNFTLFLKEFRQAVIEEAFEESKTQLLISIAVAAGKKRIDQGYEIKEIVPELDFINLMAFDFHGNWDFKTGLNAPLYANENTTDNELEFNQDWSVSYWIKNGCPPYKLILGLPAYGRTFYLKDKKKSGLPSETIQSGAISGNYTKTSGFLSYYEICQLKKNKNWTQLWLPQSKSHILHKGNDWISYDDLKSFHLRAAYVVAKKLGGIFIWSIDMDDFSGKFCDQGSYPLIKNSMSLLMDYLPEWYSSSFSNEKNSLKNTKISEYVQSNSKVFYLLKDEFYNLDELSTTQLEHDFDLVKQNRIRNDLLMFFTQQPDRFYKFNFSSSFSCLNKKRGLHRDTFDCKKYYFCDDVHISGEIKAKPLNCPNNFVFNMKGCFCDESIKDFNCEHLKDTFCDIAKFKVNSKNMLF